MRLVRIWLAFALMVVGSFIFLRGVSMHEAYKADYLAGQRPARAPMSAADLFLLASILGVGIAGVWIGMVWRAAQ